MSRLVPLIPCLLLVACASTVRTPVERADARAEVLADGARAIAKHQCTRCHTIDDLPTAARPLNCVGCHQFLDGLERGSARWNELTSKWGEDLIERYQRNLEHLLQAPDLTGVARRLRPSWLERFVQQPHDLRPLLTESMPRTAVDAADARRIARYFAAVADAPPESALPPAPDAARLAAGGRLFAQRGCGVCHTLGNASTGVPAEVLHANARAARLAPNLRFTRERMRVEAVVPWLLDPKDLLASTSMPNFGLTIDEAQLLRDWVLYADPQLEPAAPLVVPQPPAPLSREVSWEEVKERVLGKVCVHCHMNDFERDTGPGNGGGLGYAGVGLRMRTYEMLVAGALDERGQRYSVLVPAPGQRAAPIVQAMLRRRAEAARDAVEPFHDHVLPSLAAKPGMPLGFPAMGDEELALLVTWIARGCPGPREVTGRPDVDDGFLVPDGPIEKNQGCEFRPPSPSRPPWAPRGQ